MKESKLYSYDEDLMDGELYEKNLVGNLNKNHILDPWRGSVRVWLTKGQIREFFPEMMEGIVVVIGVVLVGFSAERQLLSFDCKVVVLEGRNHPGGRVYTQRMGSEAVLAQQLSIPLHKVRINFSLYKLNGEPVDK
ncbi:flavin containing amine oxidase [Medicago truncatula]|uniref:Flavin containing amine oxidase n=1 Tax=Medicago truncatula TaxID=3880 RepID=G7IM95_MEDTR|nr:flavin containing amine oxidase [Medicago truncatula]